MAGAFEGAQPAQYSVLKTVVNTALVSIVLGTLLGVVMLVNVVL